MSLRLIVFRHAKTATDPSIPTDAERPLMDRGVEDARRMGAWMKEEGLVPDRVVSSTAKRARQTTEEALDVMGLDTEDVAWDDCVYENDVATLVRIVEENRSAGTLLLVGHNPSFEGLVLSLCADVPEPPDGKVMRTASVAVIEVPPEDDVVGACRLERIQHAGELARV
jgi:phosphohistidine phosphatase